MKKFMPVIISLILPLIFSAPTLVSSYDIKVANDDLSLYAEQGMPIQVVSDENHNIYTVTITDKEILTKIQEEENRTKYPTSKDDSDNFFKSSRRNSTPYERTKAEIYSRGNKWQIENWESTHN